MRQRDEQDWLWLTSQSMESVMMVFEHAGQDIVSVIKEARQLRHNMNNIGRSKRAITDPEKIKIHRLRAKTARKLRKDKARKKARTIDNHYFTIKQLRENEHLSWEEIRRYLKRNLYCNVSRSYLHKVWKELVEIHEATHDENE